MTKLGTFHIFDAVAAIRVTQNSGEGNEGDEEVGEEELLIIEQCPMPNAQCPMPIPMSVD
ncbi:hypothetical protein [Nostoc sp.]|uniref:hypothetical protein n=1 Tax=Nostoc sp. TaxID=1180 RepID=UPI002FF5C940